MRFLQPKYFVLVVLIAVTNLGSFVLASKTEETGVVPKTVEQSESQPSSYKCPKCGGEMEEGFLTEQMHTYAIREWVKGKVEYDWGLVKVPPSKLKVYTYRCIQCGFLGDSYAK
jgi:predicted RNA-binding Zn-ribbon protein involved in translation (DUF1610 family)